MTIRTRLKNLEKRLKPRIPCPPPEVRESALAVVQGYVVAFEAENPLDADEQEFPEIPLAPLHERPWAERLCRTMGISTAELQALLEERARPFLGRYR